MSSCVLGGSCSTTSPFSTCALVCLQGGGAKRQARHPHMVSRLFHSRMDGGRTCTLALRQHVQQHVHRTVTAPPSQAQHEWIQ